MDTVHKYRTTSQRKTNILHRHLVQDKGRREPWGWSIRYLRGEGWGLGKYTPKKIEHSFKPENFS